VSESKGIALLDPLQVLQIAFVTDDLDAAMRRYSEGYGITPWSVYEISSATVRELKKYDGRTDFAYKAAMCHIRTLEWELVEPLDERSIYAEALRNRGPSLHHVAFEVPDFTAALRALEERGKRILQSGNWSGKRFAHIDTFAELGYATELFEETPELEAPVPIYRFPPHQ
jgi:catechol 2,3-dioxygenase-like lactoylglutathione lyase family enzyme